MRRLLDAAAPYLVLLALLASMAIAGAIETRP